MNTLCAFAFENHIAHGAVVALSEGVEELLGSRAYSADVRRLVGEALAAMPLLSTHLHFEGRINLQFQNDHLRSGQTPSNGRSIEFLVAQVDRELQVRGMARAEPQLAGDFTQLLSGGLLALMLEPANPGGAESLPPHQALVPIEGARLSDALETYFERSEQLPTLIRLAAIDGRLGGFLLQRLPLQGLREADAEWEHLRMLASTLTPQELLEVDAHSLLHRLFHNEELRVFAPRPVTVRCRCSRTSIARLLLSLGREEVEAILAEQGRIAVTCEFCGKEYVFAPHAVAELLIASGSAPSSDARH